MVDTIRTLSELQALIQSGVPGNVSAQNMRDLLVSCVGGYGLYEDEDTKTTPLVGLAGVAIPFVCDSAGFQTDTEFLPWPKQQLTDELWDSTLNKIELANLPRGDRLEIRLNFEITPASPNSTVDIGVNIFNSAGDPFPQFLQPVAELKSSGLRNLVSDIPLPIGVFWAGGRIGFDIICSVDSTVEIGGLYIRINR